MSNVLLYTSIFGPYDALEEVPTQTIAPATACYTDQDFSSVTWQIIKKRLRFSGSTVITSRFYKINPIKSDHEFCIYIDGSFRITNPNFVEFMLDNLSQHDFVFFKHPWRHCIYDEAEVCMTAPKYNPAEIKAQIEKYARCEMPRNYGLWACGVFAFRNSDLVRQFRNAWWQEIIMTTQMDQISMPYVMKKNGFEKNVKTVELDIFNNQYLSYIGHKMEYVAKQVPRIKNTNFLPWLRMKAIELNNLLNRGV